jgi:hypothetical protein
VEKTLIVEAETSCYQQFRSETLLVAVEIWFQGGRGWLRQGTVSA